METKQKGDIAMSKLCFIGLVLALAGFPQAASQLAPLYQAIANNPRAAEGVPVDLFKADVSEEVPVMITAINSGNRAVMDAAALDAIAMLRIHKMDGENPNFRKLKPSLPEVIKEFKRLTPVLTAHFEDPEPEVPGALSKDTFTNTPWKTKVVQFLDLMGEAPTPEMVAWMLQVVQWPNGRAQEYVARIEKEWIDVKPDLAAMHDSFLRGMMDVFRADALNVAPVLAHLNPMPRAVVDALMRRIEDSKEPLVATAIIKGLAENKASPAEIVNSLVPKALDIEAPVDVRVAAIYAVAKLRPNDRSRLASLRGEANERIEGALIDMGVR
jgi:hypothetical protein